MLLTLKHRAWFAILALAALTSTSAAQSEGIAWRTDFDAARAEAAQAGKLVLVHFWTESCGPCRVLEKRVFSQPQVALGVANDYVPVKINANEKPELAQAFGVTRVPTDVVVAADGKPIKAFISPSTPMEYVGVVRQLAAAYRAQAGANFAAATQAAPAPTGLQAPPTPPTDNRYAQLAAAPAPPAYAPQAMAPTQGVTPVAAPSPSPAPATMTDNRYAVPAPATPAAPAPTPPTENPYAAAPAPVTPEPVTPAAPVTPATPSPATQAASQLPPGSPPLGFEGFCPVTMKNEWRWAKGDPAYGAIHKGRTYLFASAEAQKAFLATPDAYSPVLAGADPVAAVDQQQNVPGVREHAVEYQGRFYLFANEKTLERFWSNPNGYASGAKRVAALPAENSFIR